ncbi:MAG: DegT/DnrJ/EryC1/StrS family aminotransferase [Rhodospirillales bacterium]
MTRTYPLFKVHVDQNAALSGIQQVFESGFVNEGEQVTAFANRLKEILGVEQLVAVNSCTSALTMALHLTGAGSGDEVLTTPMTCVATNIPVLHTGAKIVWADIDPASGNISVADVKAKISSRTKAVMCVDWAGTPVELGELWAVCRDAGVPLIQDAAHAFAAEYKDKSVAHYADFTCFSFQAIKHITCGDGGAIVASDPHRFGLAKKLKWFGYDRDATKDEKGNWKGQKWDADIRLNEAGYKFNMNNVSAAIGLSQLPHVEKIIGGHRRNAAQLDEAFAGHPKIQPLTRPKDSLSSFWVYTVLLAEGMDRDGVLKTLNDQRIMAGLVHLPNDIYTCFSPYQADLPGVREFERRQMSLPCGWWLDEDDMRHVADAMIAACA